MIDLKWKAARGQFFDREVVSSAAERGRKRALSKFGSFVRRRAKSSMRTRKRPSAPGEPPSAHLGLIKKFLFFVYERERQSVIIGPAKLDKPSPDALRVLEHGGDAMRRRFDAKRKRFTDFYKARPFMQPAFDAELPNAPKQFEGEVR